jgi:hypothetical protein
LDGATATAPQTTPQLDCIEPQSDQFPDVQIVPGSLMRHAPYRQRR